MAPSVASRSARLAACARPLSRSSSNAFSKSPPVSSNAFLASIIPTPASWRSFCTSLAVYSGIGPLPGLLVVPLGLDHAPLGRDLFALERGIGDGAGHELSRTDGVVVAGDHVFDQIRVAVAVDQSDHGDAEACGFLDGRGLGVDVDHEQGLG